MGTIVSLILQKRPKHEEFKEIAQSSKWQSLASKAGSRAPEAIPLTTTLGLTPSRREMEDELTWIEKVISSGGRCMNEDTKVGTLKGLFPEGGVEG